MLCPQFWFCSLFKKVFLPGDARDWRSIRDVREGRVGNGLNWRWSSKWSCNQTLTWRTPLRLQFSVRLNSSMVRKVGNKRDNAWHTYRRKFRSQTSDNMDRWKAEMGRGREKRRVEESRSEKRKSQKKEYADARKGRKVAKHTVFLGICGSGGSKSRLAKAAGAEASG